ncbi:MAG: hypothetical protein R3C59_28905 [Planctomycetaceae bacterium]
MKTPVWLFVLVACCSLCFAEKNAEIAPVLAEPGAVIFADQFDSNQLSDAWAQVRGEWKIVDGAVVGKELKADKHAAVFHLLKKNRDSIVRFSFKLNGAKEFHFSLNHAKGHLFRAIVTGDSLIVRTDADKKDKSIRSEAIGKASGKFEQDTWYTMQIEMMGDRVAVTTDNGLTVNCQHSRLDAEKPNYRFILKDEHLVIDDVKIFAVKAK